MLRLAAFRIGFCYSRISDALLKNETRRQTPIHSFQLQHNTTTIILLATLYFSQVFTGGYHRLRHILVFFYAVTGVMTFQDFQNQTKKNINPTRINGLGATVGNERLKKSMDLLATFFCSCIVPSNQSELREMDFRSIKM